MHKSQFRINGGESFEVTRDDILEAMKRYDSDDRKSLDDAGRLYAVKYESKLYPPKRVLSLVIGRSVRTFSGGEGKASANRIFRELGFEITYLDTTRIPLQDHDLEKIHAPIPSIGTLVDDIFTQKWVNLHDGLGGIRDGQYPGVYVLSYSDEDIEDKPVRPIDVCYVGMSHAGLFLRLRQFIAGLETGNQHSGAMRFFRTIASNVPYSTLANRRKFNVAAVALPCIANKSQRSDNDLRKLGEVTRLEYYVMAYVKEKTGKEPWLNKK